MKKNVLHWVLLAIPCAAVLIFALFYLSRDVETPPVALATPAVSGTGELGSGELGGGIYLPVSVTPDTVQAVVGDTLSRAENYSRTVTVESLWSSGSSSERLECHVSGVDMHIIETGTGPVRHTLLLGDEVFIWYDGDIHAFSGSSSAMPENIADKFARTLTYEELLELDPADITDAGYTDYNGTSCIFAEYVSGGLGYTSRVYIGIDTGLLMGAERYDGDMLIYRMASDQPVVEQPDSSYFERPALS